MKISNTLHSLSLSSMQANCVFVNIDMKNKKILEDFLSTAGKSLITFRYFDSRELSVIENHISTFVLLENERPVGYGHLDIEDDIIWLGIAISESAQGKGYGKKMFVKLLDTANELNLKNINLSVDADNLKAINLYKKFGFILYKTVNKTQFFQKIITR